MLKLKINSPSFRSVYVNPTAPPTDVFSSHLPYGFATDLNSELTDRSFSRPEIFTLRVLDTTAGIVIDILVSLLKATYVVSAVFGPQALFPKSSNLTSSPETALTPFVKSVSASLMKKCL